MNRRSQTLASRSSDTKATYTDGLLEKQEQFGTGNVLIASTSYTYDALARTLTATDSRTGTVTYSGVTGTGHTPSGNLLGMKDAGNRLTTFTYDSMGRRLTTTLPDTTVTHTSYTATGRIEAEWGSQTYPTFRTYDSLGHLSTLRTKPTLASSVPTNAGGSVTTWLYDSLRGWLTEKNYNGETSNGPGNAADYTYTLSGRLHTRTWERGVVTTYGYDQGSLETVTYTNDPANTPNVTTTYDSFGRQKTVSNGIASSTFDYAADLGPDSETITYTLPGQATFTRVLDHHDRSLGRDTGWDLKKPLGTNPETYQNENTATYGYDSAGRIGTVANASDTFTYGYLANSSLLETVTANAGGIHSIINSWESSRNVLDQKQNKVGTTVISSFDYTVNAIGQRTDLATAGTEFPSVPSWIWGYDSLGQVTSADSSVSSSDRAYQYDAIGNRIEARDGVTAVTGTPNYTSNALNQYSAVGALSPAYDLDGNATAYPLPAAPGANSSLAWDAENRLLETQVAGGGPLVKTLFDARSRRIAETIGTVTTLFVYDGWNCIAEYSGATLAKARLWGLDLSGTLQGAGGVGGLLAEKQGAATFYPTFDGNGNVSEYLTSAGSVAAHFEYDPFGNTLVNTDSTNKFSYRFSTKPLSFETGLYYYGYRYYDPKTGRWPSRDPIEEKGGMNLYGFVRNDGIGRRDRLGLIVVTESGWANENVRIERKAISREYYHLSPTFEEPYTSNEGRCMQRYDTHHMEVTKWDVYQYGQWFNAEADSQRSDNLAFATLLTSIAIAKAPNPGTAIGGAVFMTAFYLSDKYFVTVNYEEQLHTLSSDTTYRKWTTSFTRKLCDCACEYESCSSKPIPPVDAAEGLGGWENVYY